MRDIVPVVRGHGRLLVTQAEHHKFHLRRVLLTDRLQAVFTRLQRGTEDRTGYVGLAGSPSSVVNGIAYLSCYFLSCRIQATKRHLRQLVCTHLLRNVARQNRRLVAQRQHHGTVMGLSRHVRHLYLSHELVEHRTIPQFL